MPRHDTAFLFDLDGTLIDSVYQHVLAWKEALDREGVELSVWRIHRKIGMSGGLFTNILLRETGLEITADRLDRLRQWHAEAFNRQHTQGSVGPQSSSVPGWANAIGFALVIGAVGFMVLGSVTFFGWLFRSLGWL